MRYLNTRGRSALAVAVCDRCRLKLPYVALSADRNAPGLRVCKDCNDELDPYRLPARQPEDITLPHARPDEPITTASDTFPSGAVDGEY
jgi:hypothetical protein